jgi:hypothetical protein
VFDLIPAPRLLHHAMIGSPSIALVQFFGAFIEQISATR